MMKNAQTYRKAAGALLIIVIISISAVTVGAKNTPKMDTPDLNIYHVYGGRGTGIFVGVNNTGDSPATDVTFTITFTGGVMLRGRQVTGSLPMINVSSCNGFVTYEPFGIGKVDFSITVTCAEGSSDTKTVSGFLFFIFVFPQALY